jgi:hypothetical protein
MAVLSAADGRVVSTVFCNGSHSESVPFHINILTLRTMILVSQIKRLVVLIIEAKAGM